MGVIILATVSAIILGSVLWLVFGSRLHLNEDPPQNSVLNVIVYILCFFVVTFTLFFAFLG